MDKLKYQYEGLKWLVEMEMLHHPQLLNTIKLNILMVSKHIKEVELLIYRENKSILVLVELSWWGRRPWMKRRLFSETSDILLQILPTFEFRVTDNPAIMNAAIELVKKAVSSSTKEESKKEEKPTQG